MPSLASVELCVIGRGDAVIVEAHTGVQKQAVIVIGRVDQINRLGVDIVDLRIVAERRRAQADEKIRRIANADDRRAA